MAHWKTFFPSPYLRKEDIPQPLTVRIVSQAPLDLEGDKGKERKICIVFKCASGDGKMVWNKTNCALAEKLFDEPDPEKWIGKLVTMRADDSIMFGAEKTGGIRVCGSPDLAAPKTVSIKRPRRKNPEIYELTPTPKKAA